MAEYKVSLRGGFSDRNNIKPISKLIQTTEFDERSRMALINALNQMYAIFRELASEEKITEFWDQVLSELYNQQVDYLSECTYNETKMLSIVNKTIAEGDYDDVLTVIEYFIAHFCKMFMADNNIFEKTINAVFEKEYIGYRYVKDQIVPITDDVELEAIGKALNSPYTKVNEHLSKALSFLSDRNSPDYENSIKESITAVEAMCTLLLGKKGTLSDALKQLSSNGIAVHNSMKEAFIKLYGYTGDASGIRHAGKLDGERASFEEAQYMLVSCSAFINYLKAISSRQKGADHE